MNVIMAFNTGFLLPALTAVYSLFVNNDNIRLRVLYAELSDQAKTVLSRLEKAGSNNTIEYVPVEGDLLERIKVSTGRWRQESFFRYYVTEIIPELDKVLWLDADILVRKSIEELYNIDFEGKSYAGVFDNSSNPEERLGIREYINSGILLINTEKIKETGKIREFWELVGSPEYAGDLPDQDALNIVFKNDIRIIDDKYNVFPLNPNDYADQLIRDTVIIHFVSDHKPWKKEEEGYFYVASERYRTAKCFVEEYHIMCDRAVSFIE